MRIKFIFFLTVLAIWGIFTYLTHETKSANTLPQLTIKDMCQMWPKLTKDEKMKICNANGFLTECELSCVD